MCVPRSNLATLVGIGEGVVRLSETDLVGAGVEDEEVPLKEGEAVNEVKSFTRGRTEVADDEVDAVLGSTDSGVELCDPLSARSFFTVLYSDAYRARPDLSVRSELKSGLQACCQ